MFIRSGLHRRGFRFSLHRKDLPGKPDLVLPKYNAVIFVHGCFWHGHDCHLFKWPSSRAEWWKEKIEGNRNRDALVKNTLADMGWRQARVWECALKGKERRDTADVLTELSGWLDSNQQFLEIRGSAK